MFTFTSKLKLITTDKLMTELELRTPKTKNTTELCSIFSTTVFNLRARSTTQATTTVKITTVGLLVLIHEGLIFSFNILRAKR